MDQSKPIPELFTYRQAAKIIGLSELTLRRKGAAGEIAHYKIGKNVRFSMEQLKGLIREVPALVEVPVREIVK